MSEQKRLNSYRAKLDFTILAHTPEEAEQLLEDLAKNLNRFSDLALVKGEMFPVIPQDVEGFKKEATSPELFTKVRDFVINALEEEYETS